MHDERARPIANPMQFADGAIHDSRLSGPVKTDTLGFYSNPETQPRRNFEGAKLIDQVPIPFSSAAHVTLTLTRTK